MKEPLVRVGDWRVERTLGGDLSGTYHAVRRDDGARATLFRPSGELLAAPDELVRIVELHRDLLEPEVVRFYRLEHDGDEPFLIGDAVDDALVSLHRGPRPGPGQTRSVGAALAAALAAVHDRGVIHGGLELHHVLWAPGRVPRILGTGLAVLGLPGAARASADVAGLGRLLCALVASWPPRGTTSGWSAADSCTVERIRVIADPGAAISMRQAYALLATDEPDARDEPTCAAAAEGTSDPAGDAGAERAGRLGRYRILSRLGCGGMGEVFLAEDPALRRGVAIKRIRPALRSDRTFRARLRREAQLAGLLSHRAIVQVFDLITDDSVDHLIMEYVPGPSLHTLLAGSPMPVAQAVRIAAEIADGLACAHRHGIVHRDLKLENILIGTDGQPKIADFGIARRTASAGDRGHESLTRDGLVVGTSRAMSPEQIQNHDIDARSDLFSFGVMLYELVTGVSPFAAPAEALTMLRILTERHTPAHALCSGVPRALSDLIDDLLEKIPARRPDSARTVRDRLRRMPDLSSAPRAPHDTAHEPGPADAIVGTRPLDAPVPDVPARTRIGRGSQGPALGAAPLGDGSDPLARRCLSSRIQAPFVLAEIRALRSSIFKRSPEIQSALAIASKVELSYDLRRADLFIPAGDTWCAILEPFAATVLTGTLRRIGYEIFPQYVALLGIAEPDVKAEMDLKTPTDLVRVICDAYSKCVVGSDAGTLTPRFAGGTATVEDTTFIPCQLQMGVFLGAGKLTGLFGDIALTETSCRARGGSACTYEFMFGPSWLAAPKRPGDI